MVEEGLASAPKPTVDTCKFYVAKTQTRDSVRNRDMDCSAFVCHSEGYEGHGPGALRSAVVV